MTLIRYHIYILYQKKINWNETVYFQGESYSINHIWKKNIKIKISSNKQKKVNNKKKKIICKAKDESLILNFTRWCFLFRFLLVFYWSTTHIELEMHVYYKQQKILSQWTINLCLPVNTDSRFECTSLYLKKKKRVKKSIYFFFIIIFTVISCVHLFYLLFVYSFLQVCPAISLQTYYTLIQQEIRHGEETFNSYFLVWSFVLFTFNLKIK